MCSNIWLERLKGLTALTWNFNLCMLLWRYVKWILHLNKYFLSDTRNFLPVLMMQTTKKCCFAYISPYNLRPLGFMHGVFLQGMGLLCGVSVNVWVLYLDYL